MLLREKDRQTLLRIFSTIAGPVEIWAYGSRVNDTAHEGSDLDLVLRSGNGSPLPYSLLKSLKTLVRDSNIPILVDLHDWAMLPPNFQRNIEAGHEVFFVNAAAGVQ